MSDPLSIDAMRDQKDALERSIAEQLIAFSRVTGLTVTSISVRVLWRSVSANDYPPEHYTVEIEARL